jgi:hypothetical protein
MSTAIPQRLGDFEILRELGRGGMGVVYEARQVSLNRKVALKVLSGGLGLTLKAVMRFRREAEAAAKLHHTNIVPVYATGEEDGVHFYAMELIKGASLDRILRQLRQTPGDNSVAAPGGTAACDAATGPYLVPPVSAPDVDAALSSSALRSDAHYFDTVARLIADVADALDHAHKQGVVHRDVKPSNLLLSAEGRLSVTDFGLARMLERPGMTLTGEFVGTPAYMSPEQITAGRTPLDHRTDIYSLGASLYELLTLRPPFTGERRDQVLAQILHKEPRPPRKLSRRVPVDLETICLKAMDKDPDRRYQTTGLMADDLRRFANRFAIAARRAGPVERLRKWVRRRPALAAASACALLAVLTAGFFAYRAQQQGQQLQAERLQRAIDDAVAASMGGDLERSEKAIRAAELQGASTGQVRLLRGLVSFQRSDIKPAIADLEQAAQLMPDSVAVRALLATFYERAGQGAKRFQLVDELASMEPVSPEDYLFKGYQQSVHDPDLALPTLDEAVRRRDTAIARAVRAEARARYALEFSDRTAAARAQEDARVARGLLPDNPFALSASAQAHLAAAILHGENGDPENRQSAQAEMEREVRDLERFDQYPFVGVYRSLYFDQMDKAAAAGEALRRAADRLGNNPSLFDYAADWYRRGDVEQALKVLARRKDKEDPAGDLLRAYVLAERKEDGPAQAYQAIQEWMSRYAAVDGAGEGAGLLLLLGRKPEAQAYARGRRVSDLPRTPPWREFIGRARAYASGENSSEEDFLRAAKGSRSRGSVAHFVIGMTRLADGDRQGAKQHLRQTVDNQGYLFVSYWLSRALLVRLEYDTSWPPWILTEK